MASFRFVLLIFFWICVLAFSHGTMNLHFTYNASALCNDGSPAGYYFRKGNSSRWVLYLQGGAFCFDDASCASRWKRSPQLMSSKNWSSTIEGTGLLSADPVLNPHWFNASVVSFGYCSSDAWSGDSFASETHHNYNFLGSRIVPAIVLDLISKHGLDKAQDILFTGSSAGAEGLYVHTDAISRLFPQARFRTFVDSAWFLDYEPFAPQPCYDCFSCTEQGGLQRGVTIWQPKVNAACAAAKGPNHLWECILGHRVFPFIQNPMLIFVYRFDAAQMSHDAIPKIPESGPQLAYAQEAAANLTRSLEPIPAVFSPACYDHTISTIQSWNGYTISGMTIYELLWTWFHNPHQHYKFIDTCNTPNCNPTCAVHQYSRKSRRSG